MTTPKNPQPTPPKRPCSCGLYHVEPGRAFYGEGGSIHAERLCVDWYGDPIEPAQRPITFTRS